MTTDALKFDSSRPRVLEVDVPEGNESRVEPPRVILTEWTERAHPIQPAGTSVAAMTVPKRRDGVVGFGLAGIGIFFSLWLVVDTVSWISTTFAHDAALGALAAIGVAAGITGAGAVIAREVTSLLRLKSVEVIQDHLRAPNRLRPAEARRAIADILAVVPRDGAIPQAIESFQRQAQAHHTAVQQIEILTRTVIAPLDRRAEADVQTAVLGAFSITAISPTALSDAVFFLACGVRMVRAIAASYGHRPTAAATVHLLRRLVLEAGKLGIVDIASASLVQHLGGAVTERIATSAADALYAAYRMARLGIVVMELCRPVPFRDEDVPSVTALVAKAMQWRSNEHST
jgi:putative membrane protein